MFTASFDCINMNLPYLRPANYQDSSILIYKYEHEIIEDPLLYADEISNHLIERLEFN